MARLAYLETLESINHLILAAHLEARGLDPDGEGGWRRGSVWGGWIGVSPYTWPVRVTLTGRDLAMRVRAPGQRLTESESKFWDTEWEMLYRAALGQPTPQQRARRRHEAAVVENGLLVAGAATMGGVAAAAVGVLYGRQRGLLAGGLVSGLVMGAGSQLLRERTPRHDR